MRHRLSDTPGIHLGRRCENGGWTCCHVRCLTHSKAKAAAVGPDVQPCRQIKAKDAAPCDIIPAVGVFTEVQIRVFALLLMTT